MLRGSIDIVNLREVSGWAQEDTQPDTPVSLLVIDNDQLIGRILANRHRPDLEQAKIGSGRHSFEYAFPKALSPSERHELKVCRESDGVNLAQSPVVLEPKNKFDEEAQSAITEILKTCGSPDDVATRIDFLIDHVDHLLDEFNDHESRRVDRKRYRDFLHRWRRSAPHDATQIQSADQPQPVKRALVIDDRIPKIDRDAGSVAIVSHMQSLQRLGYQIVFAPTAEFRAVEPAFETQLRAFDISLCVPPYWGSIEELLKRQAGEFDVIYLHRVGNATRYLELARFYNPKALRIYSVADLHYLRMERQAAVEDRPELLPRSRSAKFFEIIAAASANAVITHSPFEAQELAKQVPASKVHTIAWAVPTSPTDVPFTKRRGIAFIGGYSHDPNVDAAHWLISEIMPLVRKSNPEIECLLVGSDMPERLRALCPEGIVPVGHVDELKSVFDKVRLTVAPLAFGAGIKGKVLESLAAGIPCVCTPYAAEGLNWPKLLQECIANDGEGLARRILELHSNEALNSAVAKAAVDFVATEFSAAAIDEKMAQILRPLTHSMR